MPSPSCGGAYSLPMPSHADLSLHTLTQQTLLALPPGPSPVPPTRCPQALLPCYLPEPGTGLSGEIGLLAARGGWVLRNTSTWQFPAIASPCQGWM